jgi:hypothetical protein
MNLVCHLDVRINLSLSVRFVRVGEIMLVQRCYNALFTFTLIFPNLSSMSRPKMAAPGEALSTV